MSDSANQLSQQSVLRYSLRSVLIATTVIAILCAILATLIRSLPKEQQKLVSTVLISAIAGILSALFFACIYRFRTEKFCGKRLFAFYPPKSFKKPWRKSNLAQFVIPVVFLWFTLISNLIFNIQHSNMPFNMQQISIWPLVYNLITGFISGVYIAAFFIRFWWRGLSDSIEFCENGFILNGIRYRPWTNFYSYEKSSLHENKIVLRRKKDSLKSIQDLYVLKEHREEVLSFLQKKISVNTQPSPRTDT